MEHSSINQIPQVRGAAGASCRHFGGKTFISMFVRVHISSMVMLACGGVHVQYGGGER